MPTPSRSTLAAAFATLEAEREASWSPDRLRANRDQRRALVAAFDPARAVAAGDVVAPATLVGLDGAPVTLDALVADGPAVLIAFRYAECPADNLALPHYDAALWPPLAAADIPLVAVSPQVPARVAAIGERHGLRLTLLSDPGNALARRLGLVFTPVETPDPPPPGWVGEITATGSWELPQTAILVLDPGRRVRLAAISPDWLNRIEAADVLAVLGLAEPAPTGIAA